MKLKNTMSNNYEAIALATSKEVLDDKNEFMFKVLNEANRWTESETELAQGRSDFQIEKFIIHDNFTLPSAFKSALINRRSVAEGLLQQIIEAKRVAREFHYKWDGKDKTQPIWWKTRDGGEELCWYDIDEFHFHRMLEGLNRGFKSSVEELECFDKLINRLVELNGGQLVSREQYNADQPNYWERRLANQSLDDLLAAKTGVNAGNIRSMRRASAPTVLTDDVNRTKGSFGDPNNPLDFLTKLQENVAAGIEEITGMDKALLSGIEEKEEAKKITSSLFNQDLKVTE
jgi:hypothetical protein